MPAVIGWTRLWTAALFIAGLVGWSYVMGWGLVPLNFHDWANINVPRLMFLQNALRGGDWPLHMAGTAALHGITDRFLTLPDVITSPQTLLLLWMPIETFVFVDVLIHYTAGFVGLALLRRHFGWSLLTFTVVCPLFLFNGHILAHYSVGHFTWGSYFLFPLVALLLFRFLDGDASWRAIALFALVMFYMVLAGGQHHMTWVLLLLALLVPFCWDRAWWLLTVMVASGLLSAVRLLPPALELQSFRSAGLVDDVVGFPSLSHLVLSLLWLQRETPAFNETVPGNFWFFNSAFYEFTTYVGAIGVALLVVGVYRWLRSASPRHPQLIVPVFMMTALSIGSTYRLVRALGIPLLDGERYTARMFSLPLFFLIVMAALPIDRWLRDATMWQRRLAIVAVGFLAIETSASLRLWRVAVSAGTFGPSAFDAAATAVAHRTDPAYTTTLAIGLAVTVLTAVGLLWLAARERYRGAAVTRSHSA